MSASTALSAPCRRRCRTPGLLWPAAAPATKPFRNRLRRLGVRESRYEGPTTILSLLAYEARQQGIDTLTLILQLPAYAQLERDYRGLNALLELLSGVYGLSLDIDESMRQEVDRQSAALEETVQQDPRLKNWVQEMETLYDSESAAARAEEEPPSLSPELEQFLQDIERRWDEPEAG